VTGVCSAKNAEMVDSIGADRVVDYERADFTQGEARYDLIFDLVSNHPFSAYRRILNREGSSSWRAPAEPTAGRSAARWAAR